MYIYIKLHQDFIGDASLSAEQQIALKTRSLCNLWEPSNDDEDTINAIVLLEDRGIDAIPTDDSDKRIKHDNTVVQYSRAMHGLSQRNSESHVPKNGIQQ